MKPIDNPACLKIKRNGIVIPFIQNTEATKTLSGDKFVWQKDKSVLENGIRSLDYSYTDLINKRQNPTQLIKMYYKRVLESIDTARTFCKEEDKNLYRKLAYEVRDKTSNNFMAITDDLLIKSGFLPQLKGQSREDIVLANLPDLQKMTFKDIKETIYKTIETGLPPKI
jgi:hypothetical protein